MRLPTRLLGALAIAGVVIMLGPSAAFAGSHPPLTQTTWRQAIKQLQLPGRGCYTAAFPAVTWQQTRCATAPQIPYRPGPTSAATQRQVRRQVVGNGTDYSAQVAGAPIFDANGSFDTGSSVTSVGTFSLQLNVKPFISPTCSTALAPSSCRGWQQFIYSSTSNIVFMQYWLLDYSKACPSGWTLSGASCFRNSPATSLKGGPLTAANLTSAVLNGTASSGNDTVSLSDGGMAAASSNPDSVVDLAPNWKTVEFAVVGDGNGSQATFGTGTTLNVKTVVNNGSSAAPTCVLDGFTGETNNLDLAPTPTLGGGIDPEIESVQNSTGGTPSCAAAHGDGDTHLMTFHNLLYDFQAQGDFQLAGVGSAFVVQNRQLSGAPNWPDAAVNRAIAAHVATSNVAVCAAASTPLRVNGKPRAMKPGGLVKLPGGASVSLDKTGTTYLIQDGSGNSVTAAIGDDGGTKYLNAALGLGRWPEVVRGLLANAAGNTNPTAIQPRTGGVLTSPYSFTRFYGTYGTSWRVTGKADLLAACGAAPQATNPKTTFYTRNLTPVVAREARDACLKGGVQAPALLDACTIDEAVLGPRAPVVYRTLPAAAATGQISPPENSRN